MNRSFAAKLLFTLFLGICSFHSYSQELNTFDVRYQSNLRGDLTFIGNNILNRDSGTVGEQPNDPYNNLLNDSSWSGANDDNSGATNYNDYKQMQYIDVDSDPSTFSSSTSTFTFPSSNCNLIRYAGLYWSATYPSATANGSYDGFTYTANTVAVGTDRQSDFNQVKFRVPGGIYVDITADEILYDGFTSTDSSIRQNSPYSCYADVTNLVTALADPQGDYTVANVRATTGGLTPGGGSAAGWTLVIVYENPTLSGKLIATFDGFARVNGSNSIDIDYSGFETIPVGPVNVDLGAGTLEGDFRITGDGLSIQAASSAGFTTIHDGANPSDNFFNSNISLDGAITTNRNPASSNTLGYDTDIFLMSNPSNAVIPNGETAATFRFSTNGDQYYPFFNSFNVEVIEPNIVLEKRVEDIGGNDITGTGVNLGQYLDYVLTFQNIGNDNAQNYTIRDVLPINVSIDLSNITLPTGVPTPTYNPTTREIVFTIPDSLVEENDPQYEIRMRVQVAENCFDFVDACTDQIENLAYSTYYGEINTAQITDDPSVTDFDSCGFVTPGATNFLLDDLENCNYTRTVQLCGEDVLLDAGDNFDAYVWYIDENADGEIDAGDTVITDGDSDNDPSTILVDETGQYIVDKQVADPCKGFQEIIIVELFGATQSNPITALINDTSNTVEGTILTCPNDGEELPEIFLCGLNDTELVQINIPDADSIVWEQLDEASCSAATPDCANKNNTCTWNNVGSGSDFLASDAGEYRLQINYQNGCFSRFYFNVYKNPLDPQYTSRDLICNSLGNITVTNVPTDYEFQLVDASNDNILVPYNSDPSFDITSNGAYRVEIRQQGVTNGCVFILDNIGILERNFQVDVTPRDTDCNGLGEISISALDVEPQYYYEISQGGTTIDTFGPSNDNNYTFANLNDGVYDISVTTDDGCSHTEQVTINDVSDLAVGAIMTKAIDCLDGTITVTATGGFPNPDYFYAIWSYVDESGTTQISYPDVASIPGGAYQTGGVFSFTASEAGDYEFIVVDGNNCSAVSNIVSIGVSPAVEYTTSQSDETCYGSSDGSFAVNVTNSNGYSLSYELTYPDASTDTNTSGAFTGLPQGNYSLRIIQTQGAISCDYIETFTIGGPVDLPSGNAVLLQEYTCIQNGSIEAQNVTGGTAPYEYSIDGVNFVGGAGAETFTNLTDGTYNITIRDANGCTIVTNSVTFDPLVPPSDLTFSATAPNCPANISDVVVSVVDGEAPYVFEIVSPTTIAATSTSGNTANFDGLSPGTYTFRVTDNKGCSYNESFTINPVTPINVTSQLISNITCFGDTDGEISFSISGFSTDYDYAITGPSGFSGNNETSTTLSFPSLDVGAYTITVTDNVTNCTDSASVTVNGPIAALTLVANDTQPTCLVDGSVVLTSTGGWGSNTFTLINPDASTFGANSTGVFNNLLQSGTYTAEVSDVNGCVVSENFTLNAAVAPVLQLTPNDFCYDSGVGLTLTASITSGGDGNFEYSLNGGAYDSANVFSSLGPGTYTVDVRDGNSCTDSASITINPELTVVAAASNITACATTTNINITAAGGDGNYVYAIVADGVSPTPGDFSTTNPITVSAAGDYDVYVRDSNGSAGYCEALYDITIIQDPALSLSISNTPILCSGDSTSTITITASGGEAPYFYSIDNGTTYQSSNSFVNQGAANYTIRVQDANGCEISQVQSITEPLPLSASAAVTQLAECNPGTGAEVRITNVIGGTSPYEYSFDGGSNYSSSAIGFLLPGTHTVLVRDANNCSFPMSVTVEPEPTPPNATTSISYECDGEGTITVTPDSGAYDYTYELNGVPNSPDTSNVFADVSPGSHTVTINYTSNTPPTPSTLLTEDFGQGGTTAISEVDPGYCFEPLDGTGIGCNASSPGALVNGEYTVTQAVTGSWSGWRSPNDHTGNANGRFLAMDLGTVVGLDGIIYAKRNIEIVPNQDLTVSMFLYNMVRDTHSGSQNDPDVRIELVDLSGTVIDFIATGNIPRNTNADDWHNYSFDLNPGGNSTIDIVIRTNINTNHGNDLAIDDIQAFQTPEVCSSSITVDVQVEAGFAFDADIIASENISCNGLADGSITFDVENFDSVNGFEYAINGGGFSAPQTTSPVIISGLAAGPYTIEVRDVLDNSCSVTLNQTLTEPIALTTSALLTNDLTCTNGGGTIMAAAAGGTPDYEFQLEDGVGGIIAGYDYATNGNNTFFTGLAAGDYIVRAQDVSGCEDAIDAVITIVSPDAITFSTTSTSCYSGNNDATIQVDVTSGNGDYQFSLNGGAWITPSPSSSTSHTFPNLSAGSYTIDVRDGFGCAGVQQNVTINSQLTANALLTTDLTCLVLASVTVNANGGSGSYTYEWSNNGGATFASTNFSGNVFTTNTFGDFVFRVTDTTTPTACQVVTNTVTISEAQTPVISNVVPTDILCNGDSTGALDITIDTSIGVPPFVIEVIETNTSTNYGSQTTGLPAGDYSVTITDNKGCVSNPFLISISEPDPIAYTINLQPITCDPIGGTNPGSIAVENVTGGTAEFTYHLTGNNGYDAQYTTTAGGEDHTFSILEFGIYEVDVVDANGCNVVTTNIIASPPNDLDIDVSTITASCAAGGTAIVTVSSAVGSGDYQFAILETFSAPYSTTYVGPDVPLGDTATFTGLVPGITYTFVVFDNVTNCYYFEEAASPINSPSAMTATLDNVANITCTGAADGNVSFSFDNFDVGATSVNYEIYNAQSNTTTGISGSAVVNPPAAPISVSNLGPLPQGVYYLLLEEVGGAFNGCSISSIDFTITESSNLLQVTAASPTNDNCNTNAGVITATAQFGAAPYEFQYLLNTDPAPTATDAGWTTNTTVNVESGNYVVYVKDANDCIQSDAVTVALDASPQISVAVVDECVDEGAFEVLVTLNNPVSAISPFTLSLNGGPGQNIAFNGSNQYTLSGVGSGSGQTITVSDLNGCSDTQGFHIAPPLQFTASLTTLLDCEVAPANNAEITIDVTVGSSNYDYEIDGPGAVDQARTAMGGSTVIWSGASVDGSYTITVYDTSTAVPNCLGSVVVDVPAALVPIFNETHEDVSCNGANDGTIRLFETDNGIVPLTYSISPVAGTFNAVTNAFENLPAGTYTVTATATNGCTSNIPGIIIDEPLIISVPAPTVLEFGCAAGNNSDNASITVDPSGITGGNGAFVVYEFVDTNGTPTTADDVVLQSGPNNVYIETDITNGDYIINVYDSNGCVGSTTTSIVPFDELLVASAAITNPLSCNPGNDGEITLSATSTNNDATRFEYSIDNGSTWQNSGTHTNPEIFTGLSAGTYNFLVRHIDTGCIITASETLVSPNTFTIDVVVVNDVVCFGTASGQVTFELLDGTYVGPIDWNVYDTNGTPTNLADDILVTSGSFASTGPTASIALAGGGYYVEVLQSNFPQCSNIEAFNIASPSAALTGIVDITPISCLGNDGQIEITNVSGGWGNYQYYVGASAPTGPGDYVASPNFNALASGTYQAWVIDSEGCDQLIQDNINLADPTAISASIQVNNDNCTNIEGEIEVVGVLGGQGSNYSYQLILNGTPIGSPQTNPVFAGLGEGSYQVLVSDQWSCTFITPTELLFSEMNPVATVVKDIDCSTSPDGEVSVAVTGGSSNFDYTITFPDLVTTTNNSTGVFTGLSQAGNYSITVSDLDTSSPVCIKTVNVVLTNPTPVTFDLHSIVDVSCNGGADGSITTNLLPSSSGVNDDAPYSYNLYDAAGTTLLAGPQSSPTFTNLTAAFYQIEAVSSKSCTLRQTVEVQEPPALTASASATAFACSSNNITNTSTITVTATGGAANYLYSLDNINFQASNTFEVVDNGAIQNLTVFVNDANGCSSVAPITIQPINTFTATVSLNNAISCNNPEEVLVSVTDDGSPLNAYTFELLPLGNSAGALVSNPSNTTAVFNLTEVGSFTFRITDTNTGCYVDTATYTISPYDLIDVVATPTAPAICFGDTNGLLEILVSGYNGPYDYEVFTQAGVPVLSGSADTTTNPYAISGLSGGNYYVQVTQTGNPLCVEVSNTVTINSPDEALTAIPLEVANVSCTNDQGEIEVSPQGGYAPYSIVLTNTTTGATPQTVTNVAGMVFGGLTEGNYSVQVTDSGGCVINESITLSQPLPITATIDATPTTLLCYGDTNAVITAINVAGGEGVYQYQLNEYDSLGTTIVSTSGWQTNPTFDNLGAGVYSITVADGLNCGVETAQATISEPTDVMAALIQVSAMTCNGLAQLQLTADGGTGPYEYSLDSLTWMSMSGGNTHDFSVSDGAYQYFVRDSFGCEAMISNEITVDPIPPLTITIDDSAAVINCTGEATAAIIANTTGGLGNYSFELYTDSALTNLVAGPQNNDTFENLTSGSYFVRVTSGDCEEVSLEVPILDPTPLQIDRQEFTDVSCSGLDDGSITVEVSGGTGEIFYAITPNLNQFDTENVFTDLAPGVYDVIAQDTNGCFIPFQFTITEPEPIAAAAINVLDEVCQGSEDGSFELEITGGTAPFSTSLNSNNAADYVQDQMVFDNLAAGTYVVFIRDSQNCETNVVVEIDPGVNLAATVAPMYLCTGNIPENQLDVIMEDTSVLPELLYAIDSSDPTDMVLTSDFQNLTPGPHYLTIAHSNGCINTIDFEIEAFEPLTLVLEQNNINEITAIADGGVEDYTFYFGDVDNGNDNIFYINRTDTYMVRVVDENGCEAMAEIFMEFIDVEIPNFFTPDGDAMNDTWMPDNLEAFPNALTIIFDRYGRELYRMKVNDAPWNGIYQNHELPSGDYWYVLKLNGENDDREFVGHFTLYR